MLGTERVFVQSIIGQPVQSCSTTSHRVGGAADSHALRKADVRLSKLKAPGLGMWKSALNGAG
jgi:hypothetical protein